MPESIQFDGREIQAGDELIRMIGSVLASPVIVAAVDDRFIYVGPPPEFGPDFDPVVYPGWKFDRVFGYEVDEGLGWGLENADGSITPTGSFLKMGLR